MRNALCIFVSLVFCVEYAIASNLSAVEYDEQANLLSITANNLPIKDLLGEIAENANFVLVTDDENNEFKRKISIQLEQVPLERAISLMLGNINRVVTYSTVDESTTKIEKVELFLAEAKGRVLIDNRVIESGRKQYDIKNLKTRLRARKLQKRNQILFAEQNLLSHIDNIQQKLVGDQFYLDSDEDISLPSQQSVVETNRILASH